MKSVKEMTQGMMDVLTQRRTPPAPAPAESDADKAKLLGSGMANKTANVIMKRKQQLDEVMK